MSPPAVVIRIPLEGAPTVLADYLDSGEEDRMRDWLDAHPEYRRLIAEALTLAATERAA